MSPTPLEPPTIPANWVVPVPALIVKFLVVPSELTVLPESNVRVCCC